MTFTQTMTSLEQAGTAQNRKVYARHGCKAPMFGVSFAHLGRLTKQIKTDHVLAEQLWKCGNHDARILAMMIADPSKVTVRQARSWAKDLNCYALSDYLGKLVGRSLIADEMMTIWTADTSEFVATTGWVVVALVALNGTDKSDDFFKTWIDRIERSIQSSKNWVKYAMNGALIAIGGGRPGLTARAIAAAKRIGPVEVDYGQTGCKTPAAIPYIEKMVARRANGMKQGDRQSQIKNRK